jgi:hypothetical protein
MKLLTLTPEAQIYLVAMLSVFSLAAGPTAAQIRLLWPGVRRPSFLPVYTATMAVIAGLGLTFLDLEMVAQRSLPAIGLSVLAGLVGGAIAIRSDDTVRRMARRWERRHAARGPEAERRRQLLRPPAGRGDKSVAAEAGRDTLAILLVIALLEECLFRGIVVDLSLEVAPAALAAACIVGSLAAFGAAHIYWGWAEMVAKLPLGTVALLASLPFHALVGAVVVHVMFNAHVWLAVKAVGGRGAAP